MPNHCGPRSDIAGRPFPAIVKSVILKTRITLLSVSAIYRALNPIPSPMGYLQHLDQVTVQPTKRSCWQPDHPSNRSSTVRSASESTRPVTRRCPLGNSTWIMPDGRPRWRSQGAGTSWLRSSSETVTGKRLRAPEFLAISPPEPAAEPRPARNPFLSSSRHRLRHRCLYRRIV
jgi:hypothetical protein